MKRFAIPAFSFVYFFAMMNFVYAAANPCLSNQILFRITGNGNAHAEIYNGAGNYGVNICFTDYFTSSGNGDRVCSGNEVIRLSDTTNAHAEDPALSTASYQNVCYGDLNCVLRPATNENNCQGIPMGGAGVVDGSRIVFLASQSNSHVELGSSGYNYVLCCGSPTAAPICNNNGICEGNENEMNCADCPGGGVGFCGDDVVDPGEECDDGNTIPGDGCNENCMLEGGGGGCIDDSDCDDGDLCTEDMCVSGSCEYASDPSCDPSPSECGVYYDSDSGTWNPVQFCSDYTTENCCTLDDSEVGGNLGNPDGECVWDDVNGCETHVDQGGGLICEIVTIDEGAGCVPGQTTKTITIQYQDITDPANICDCNGDGVVNPPETCEITVPCVQPVQLSFFNFATFISSIVVIGLVYLIYVTRKK